MKTLNPLYNLYGNLLIILGNFMFCFPKLQNLPEIFQYHGTNTSIERLYPGQKGA